MSCNTYIWYYTVYTLFTCKPSVDIWKFSPNIQKAGDLTIVFLLSFSPPHPCPLLARLAGCIGLISNLCDFCWGFGRSTHPLSTRKPRVTQWEGHQSTEGFQFSLLRLKDSPPELAQHLWKLEVAEYDSSFTQIRRCNVKKFWFLWGEPIFGDAVFSSWSTKEITKCQE